MNELITVFGASGFLGRHAIKQLAAAGWRIRAVCRHPHLAHVLTTAGVPGQIELFAGTVLNRSSVADALKGADTAVNLVGVLHGRGSQNFEALHIDAPVGIGEAAAEAGLTRLIHISAIGADPTAASHYAQTKGEGEKRLREAFPDAVILRPSVIFGPEDAFFNRFAAMAQISPALPLIGGGHTRLQPVYAADVAGAVLSALNDEATRGKTFELGGPKTYSFRELMQFVLTTTARKRLLVPLPVPVAKVMGFFLQLPSLLMPIAPLLTVDQVRQLETDNVVDAGALTLADLSVRPHAIEEVVPGYLARFRPQGG